MSSISPEFPEVAYSYGKKDLPSPKGPPPTKLKPLKIFQNKQERDEALRYGELRATLPKLTRLQTAEYRLTAYHNLCLDILKSGYHRSFSELFTLVQRQEEARLAAGPDSLLWNITPLNMQEDKLLALQQGLYAAEDAYRQGDYEGAHQAYHSLAIYFKQDLNCKWLVEHFLNYSLDVAQNIEHDGGKSLNAAYFHLGVSLQENGDYVKAEELLRRQYSLSSGQTWTDNQGRLWFHVCCETLAQILTARAAQLTRSDDHSQKLELLKSAFEVAKESNNKKMEGQCGYRLGQMYEVVGKPETAILFIREFYELSKRIQDDENLGLACEALAKAFEKQRKEEESIRYLKEFVEVTERSGQDSLLCRACQDLGAVYNRMGNFQEAAQYFNRALVLARSQNDNKSSWTARMMCGVASGNGLSLPVQPYLQCQTRKALQQLITWKNVRGDPKNLFVTEIADAETMSLAKRRPQK